MSIDDELVALDMNIMDSQLGKASRHQN